MATSGSTNYSINAQDIIRKALYKIEALEEGEPVTGEHTQDALLELNLMAKTWQQDGLNIWLKQELVLFLNKDQQEYVLPTAKAAKAPQGTSAFGYTRLNGAHSASATALTVDATAPGTPLPDLAESDQIGIELSDGTRFWTTVASVDSGTGITISAGLSGAAADDATVFWYTTQATMPKRIIGSRRGTFNGSEVPVDVVPRSDYFNLPNKTTSNIPVMVHYDPKNTTGLLYVWPTSSSVQNVLYLTAERLVEDFDAVTDEPDFPIEWGSALIYGLADRLAPEYQLPLPKQQAISTRAERFYEAALGFDSDVGALVIQPG